MKIVKCVKCKGTSFVKLGNHAKGVGKCPICNGTGKTIK